MKDFDYIIIGGGCAGLSLAYELEIHKKLENKTLAIIEPRLEYKKDKTWSFWKVIPHNFDDCVKKSWKNFSINIPTKTKHLECNSYPYQSIDSGLFYRKINNKLKKKNIKNYNNSGKIYVTNINKIIQTILSIADLIKLSLIKSKNHLRAEEHLIISEVVNLNERF